MTAKELYQAGQLSDAIGAVTAEVKANPADTQKRGFLAELLCFQGNVERADLQLDVMAKQDTASALGISLFRQTLRGELARRQFFGEGRLPEFLDVPPDHLRLTLEASVALRTGDAAEAVRLLEQAEAARPAVAGDCDGQAFDDLRDLDDLTAGFFEVITSSGKYYWVPTERVVEITFHAPERPRDLIWRRASMTVADGPEGDVYVPAIYVPPAGVELDEPTLLGRATDWLGGDGEPVRGVGQRILLVGDEARPLLQITELSFRQES